MKAKQGPTAALAAQEAASEPVAPDCRGLNFYESDPDFRELLQLYMAPALLLGGAPATLAEAAEPVTEA